MQVLLNVLRGMTPQAALDAPRFCISAGLPDADTEDAANAGNIDSEVWMEEGISDQVVQKLRGTLRGFPQCLALTNPSQTWAMMPERQPTSTGRLLAEDSSFRKSRTVPEGPSGLVDRISAQTGRS